MAEIAVSVALSILEISLDLLQKPRSKIDLKYEMGNMRSWLRTMKAYLEDHQGPEGSRRLQATLEEIRDIAYDIEDLIEEYAFHSPPYLFHSHEIRRKIHGFAHNFYHDFSLGDLKDKIKIINRKIDDFKERYTFLRDGPSSSSSSHYTAGIRSHPVSPLLHDDELIGYEEHKLEFVQILKNGEKKLIVVAVDGPGGSGKSTFVKNVFWNRVILGQFDCHAWVHVSQDFRPETLFVNMLKQFCGSRKEPYPPDAGLNASSILQKYLNGKRYIVVLDDVWRKEHWNEIKHALRDPFRGSRVIVTTRSGDVSSACASSPNHRFTLNGLDYLQAWTLFCRKAFPESRGECPSELKDCAAKIIKRCDGLPLAIVAVGGTLSQKQRLPNEWEKFHKNLGCGNNIIRDALLPSYLDLSSNLKCCFLYFSVFPEDYNVRYKRLIRLWVAESFVKDEYGRKAEEVAKDYLDELISRNLIQVTNWDFDGQPRYCRVSDIVLNFIIQKCRVENFVSMFPREDTSSQSLKIRRLSVHGDWNDLPKNNEFRVVRSFFLLRCPSNMPTETCQIFCQFELLKVLDFEGAPVVKFPEEIKHLVLLKYISLRDTNIKKIPSSIKKLSYLEMLDLKQTDVAELPKGISHLHNLRHLFARKYDVENHVAFNSAKGVKITEGIEKLTKLQDLSLINVGEKGRILKDLDKLIELRKLGLTGLKAQHGTILCAAVEKLVNLITLDLCSTGKDEYLQLDRMNNPPISLQRLYLKGRLQEFPSWIINLTNLQRIGLKWSRMDVQEPLETLGRLPNLIELQMVHCYIGEELTFEASAFKKLKILQVDDFAELHTIAFQQGAMPNLKKITLSRCPKMKMIPLGIEHVLSLEEFIMYDMAEKLIDRIRKNGEDRDSVRNIHVVHSFTLIDGHNWSLENLSGSSLH